MLTPSQTSTRDVAIDLLRGVAILAVVGLHVTFELGFWSAGSHRYGLPMVALHIATGFGVPAFLAASSLALCRRYGNGFDGLRDYLRFLRRRLAVLLPGYVFWSLLSAALLDPAHLARPGRIVALLVTGSADGQFYFIPLIFQLYVAWPVLLWLARPADSAARAGGLAALSVVLWVTFWQSQIIPAWLGASWILSPFWIAFALLGVAGIGAGQAFMESRHRGRVLTALAFATAGFYLLDLWDAQTRIGANDTVGHVSLAMSVMRVAVVGYSAAAIGFIYLGALHWGGGSSRAAFWLAALGRSSYGIFLCHFLLLRFLVLPLIGALPFGFRTPMGAAVAVSFVWVLCVGFSALLTAIMGRVPWLRTLVAQTAPPTR